LGDARVEQNKTLPAVPIGTIGLQSAVAASFGAR